VVDSTTHSNYRGKETLNRYGGETLPLIADSIIKWNADPIPGGTHTLGPQYAAKESWTKLKMFPEGLNQAWSDGSVRWYAMRDLDWNTASGFDNDDWHLKGSAKHYWVQDQ
jgi:hypothetical protein